MRFTVAGLYCSVRAYPFISFSSSILRLSAMASGGKPLPDRLDDAFLVEAGVRELDAGVAVVDEAVGQPELEHGVVAAQALQRLEHGAARAPHHHVLLDGHQ